MGLVYLPSNLVDFYGLHVGKYIPYMDLMDTTLFKVIFIGNLNHTC